MYKEQDEFEAPNEGRMGVNNRQTFGEASNQLMICDQRRAMIVAEVVAQTQGSMKELCIVEQKI